ncbi:MAG: hypothetical protein RBR59_02025 [Sulfurimonadaceae bacterium]|jgi:hypothetical protein|nr:hypothetical protein [Sulfurimonadaceae bacterium]
MGYLFVILIIFIGFISLSFFKGMEFAFLSYILTPLDLIALMVISLYGMFYLYYNQVREKFKSRVEILQITFLHLIGTSFLWFLEAYPLLILLQLLYPFLLLKKTNALALGAFLYLEHLILATLFISESYLFYFSYLVSLGFFLWMRKIYFYSTPLWGYSFVILLMSIFSFFFQEFLFDIYVWSGLEATCHTFDKNIFYMLTIIHILIVFVIKHKKPRGFKKN